MSARDTSLRSQLTLWALRALMSVMKVRTTEEGAIYESLVKIQLGFAQILEALNNLQQHKSYRGLTMTAAVEAVRETRAGTLFEILGVLHAREEREWARWGRRQKREGDY